MFKHSSITLFNNLNQVYQRALPKGLPFGPLGVALDYDALCYFCESFGAGDQPKMIGRSIRTWYPSTGK